MGGRPPYGYRLVDVGPHPNPSRAPDGRMLHALQRDPVTAPAIELIFAMRLAGASPAETARELVDLGFPSPSAHDPRRNPQRVGVGWPKSAVRAILANPTYTGHTVWGRQPSRSVLIDPSPAASGVGSAAATSPVRSTTARSTTGAS